MAKIEIWWRCPVCRTSIFETKRGAEECAKSHVYYELWAVSEKYPGKAVKVTNHRNVVHALREAEQKD